MSLPLPVRLTLFYALLLGLALYGFGALVYQQAEQRAYSDLDTLLSNRAASIKLGKDIFYQSNSIGPSTPLVLPGVNELGGDGVSIEIFDTQLVPLATTTLAINNGGTTSTTTETSPVPWDVQTARQVQKYALSQNSDSLTRYQGVYSIVLYEGQQVRVYTTVNVDFDRHIIQTARSEQSLQQALGELRQTLVAGGMLVFLLALGGGLFLTLGTLAPVRRVTRTAREISASQDFRRRVPLKSKAGRDEIHVLAETFNAMLANLESAYQQQKRFIADASHELRAPITSIRCNLDLLMHVHELPTEEKDAAIADARVEADRMGRLVNDLLTLARADEVASTACGTGQQTGDASKEKAQRSRVDLDSLVLEIFRQYKGSDDESRPHLTLQHITPAPVYGQADQLKQAIVALLDNALKYTPARGTVALSLTVECQEASVGITDTGIGIAPEDLPYIFERFYRADRAHSRDQGGSGLGLAIAQSIIQEHHGRIEVESSPGKGSTFLLYLPLAHRRVEM